MGTKEKQQIPGSTTRRRFIAGTGLAAASAPLYTAGASIVHHDDDKCITRKDRAKLIAAAPKAPFDSGFGPVVKPSWTLPCWFTAVIFRFEIAGTPVKSDVPAPMLTVLQTVLPTPMK